MSVPVRGPRAPAASAAPARGPRPAGRGSWPDRSGVRIPHPGPPRWAWTVCIAGVLLAMAWFSRGGFYFWDDFIYLEQARELPFSLGYLRIGVFDHFSPVMRAWTYLVVHAFSSSWGVAHLLQLVMLAAAVLAFAALVRTLFGTGWTALVLTVAFGQSLFLLRLLQWWTSSAQILSANVLLVLTLLGFVRYRATGRRRDLVMSLVTYCLAVLAWEQAMMLVGYLLLLRLLILEERASLAGWARALWRERWIWVAYSLPTVLGIVNYYARYYAPQPRPTAGALLRYLRVAVAETFLPAAVGVWRPLADLGASRAALLTAALAVPALVVYTLASRPRAWRAWLFFAIAAIANTVVLGLARVTHIGPDAAGHELYYQQAGALLLLLSCGFALHPRYAGPPRRWALPRVGPPWSLLLLSGALAAYEALFAVSAGAMGDSFTFPRESRAYFDRLLPQLDALRAQGRRPVLLGGTVPFAVVPAIFAPADRYDEVFPLFDGELRFNEAGGPLYRVDPHGHLVPVRLEVAASLELGDSGRTAVRLVGMEQVAGKPGAGLCLRSGGAGGAVEIRLERPVGGPGLYVRELASVEAPSAVTLSIDPGAGWDPASATSRLWPAGSPGGLDEVHAASLARLRLEGFPPGRQVCLSRIEVGHLVDSP